MHLPVLEQIPLRPRLSVNTVNKCRSIQRSFRHPCALNSDLFSSVRPKWRPVLTDAPKMATCSHPHNGGLFSSVRPKWRPVVIGAPIMATCPYWCDHNGDLSSEGNGIRGGLPGCCPSSSPPALSKPAQVGGRHEIGPKTEHTASTLNNWTTKDRPSLNVWDNTLLLFWCS